jgi:small subunit ribosomal protein S20
LPAAKTTRAQERRRIANRRVRSSSRTVVKKAVRAMDGGDTSEATTAVGSAISALDRARTKGVTHRNAAARSKSRLMKRLNAMEAK